MNKRTIFRKINELEKLANIIAEKSTDDKRASRDLQDFSQEYLHLTSSFIYGMQELQLKFRYYLNKRWIERLRENEGFYHPLD